MKIFNYLLLAFVAIALVLGLLPSSNESNSRAESFEEKRDKLEPNDWLYFQRAFPNGKIDKRVYRAAKNIGLRMRAQPNAARNTLYTQAWQVEGPFNIGGRISAIAMPNSDSNKIYAGAASGGVFLSEDAGSSWTPIFDDALSLSIGDIAIAASNEDIIYVGTGEANAGGGSLAYDGEGVYNSFDGGDTWNPLGLSEVGSIGKVIIHPDNPNTVFVGAMGDLFGDSPHQGVYKSTNSGISWEKVLFVNDSTGVIDMAINPDNPNIVYAATWQRVRRPQRRSYGGDGSGLYRSLDGGDTWTELTNGLPTQGAEKGRIGIAVAPSQPNTVYAVYADANGFLQGMYRSDNNGNSWTTKSIEGIINVSFMWWFGKLAVDPIHPETVYFMGFIPHKSTDGGDSWSSIFNNTHVDQHALAVHPSNTDQLVLGNDGGIFISYDGGNTMQKSFDLPITQFYTCEIDEQFPERLYGGTQDNSSMRTLTGALDDWDIISGGDGFYTLVDPTNNLFVYTESQYGGFRRSIDGGFNFTLALFGIDETDRRNWNTPVAFDPSDPTILFYGTNRLYKSTNRALTWAPLTSDLTNGSGNGNIPYGTITTIGVSEVDSDILWAGTDDGNVWVSANGGANMTKVSDALPLRWVTRVVPHPELTTTAYLTLSGFRYNNNEANIYKTEDLGQTWIDIASNLPDVPVNDLIVQPESNVLFAATDIGVFYSEDDGDSWDLLGTDMPIVVVTELDYHEPTKTLVAATFGRSIYTYNLDESTNTNEPVNLNAELIQVYPNPTSDWVNIDLQAFQFTDALSIELYNAKGQLIQAISVGIQEQKVLQLDLSNQANGTYSIQIISQGERYTKKVIKN